MRDLRPDWMQTRKNEERRGGARPGSGPKPKAGALKGPAVTVAFAPDDIRRLDARLGELAAEDDRGEYTRASYVRSATLRQLREDAAQPEEIVRPGFVPSAVAEILRALGWSQQGDGYGALVWYPPAVDVETRHQSQILAGLAKILGAADEGPR